MEHAVPGAVCFQMIEHHGCLWSSVAQLALRELTLHATPNVCLACVDLVSHARVLHSVPMHRPSMIVVSAFIPRGPLGING